MTNIIGHLTNNVSLMTRGAMVMLEPLLGSISAERVLIFILAREEGYARDIARFFKADLYAIQKQLNKLETGGVLASRLAGRTRLYTFNPRYPFLKELKELLIKALSFYPEASQDGTGWPKRLTPGAGRSRS